MRKFRFSDPAVERLFAATSVWERVRYGFWPTVGWVLLAILAAIAGSIDGCVLDSLLRGR